MKKQTKAQNNNFKILSIILGCVSVVLLGALIYCCTNMKSAEDKEYLALQDHLLNRHIQMMYENGTNACGMESHSLSKDNDVAVKFWCQKYDTDTHEPIGSKEYHTLYFQHPADIQNGKGGYAEALGD